MKLGQLLKVIDSDTFIRIIDCNGSCSLMLDKIPKDLEVKSVCVAHPIDSALDIKIDGDFDKVF